MWSMSPWTHPCIEVDLEVCSSFCVVFLMIVVWNVRGAAGRDFALALKEIQRRYHAHIVVLVETRCSGSQAQKVIKKLGFSNSV